MCGSAERGTVYGVESGEVEWSGEQSRVDSSRVESTLSGVERSRVAWGCAGKCAKVHFSRKPDRPDHYRCAVP